MDSATYFYNALSIEVFYQRTKVPSVYKGSVKKPWSEFEKEDLAFSEHMAAVFAKVVEVIQFKDLY